MRLRCKLIFAVLCVPYLVCAYIGLPGSHIPILFGAGVLEEIRQLLRKLD